MDVLRLDFVFMLAITYTTSYIFRSVINVCNSQKCAIERPICGSVFMNEGSPVKCFSAQEIDDVSHSITYKYIVRPRYLGIPSAKTYKYFISHNTWKEMKIVWGS